MSSQTTTDDRVVKLTSLRPIKFHYSERYISRLFNFHRGEGEPPHKRISDFDSTLKKGYEGRKGQPDFRYLACGKVDLKDYHNPLNMHLVKYGAQESFKEHRLNEEKKFTRRQPRWFHVINKSIYQLSIKDQVTLLKDIVGEGRYLDDDTKKRRKKEWKKWYENKSPTYKTNDLPDIARTYWRHWGLEKEGTNNDIISLAILK